MSCAIVGDLRLDKEVPEVELPHHHGERAHEGREGVGEVLMIA